MPFGGNSHSRNEGIVDVGLIEIFDQVAQRSKSQNRSVQLEQEPSLLRRLVQSVPDVALPFALGMDLNNFLSVGLRCRLPFWLCAHLVGHPCWLVVEDNEVPSQIPLYTLFSSTIRRTVGKAYPSMPQCFIERMAGVELESHSHALVYMACFPGLQVNTGPCDGMLNPHGSRVSRCLFNGPM